MTQAAAPDQSSVRVVRVKLENLNLFLTWSPEIRQSLAELYKLQVSDFLMMTQYELMLATPKVLLAMTRNMENPPSKEDFYRLHPSSCSLAWQAICMVIGDLHHHPGPATVN